MQMKINLLVEHIFMRMVLHEDSFNTEAKATRKWPIAYKILNNILLIILEHV